MKVKKRKKSTRYRGSHTHGRGFKKKARGSGHRGGFGMSGTGKRADHRKTYILAKFGPDYFGKDKALRKGRVIKIKAVSLREIRDNVEGFVRRGIAKQNKDSYEINLEEYKIIGNEELNFRAVIKAKSASKSAVETVRKSGGEIILEDKK